MLYIESLAIKTIKCPQSVSNMFLTSYLIFSPLLAFLSCSSADFLPTFSFFSRLDRDLAKPHASAPSSEEQGEEEEALTWRCDSRLKKHDVFDL